MIAADRPVQRPATAKLLVVDAWGRMSHRPRAALHEFLAAHPQWNFTRYRDVHYAGLAFVVERSDWAENA